MGCCVSTNTTSPSPKTPYISNSDKQNGGSKSPPPTYSLLGEETVKEILSETTTIPKHPPPPLPRFHENEKRHHQNGVISRKPLAVSGSDEISEVDSEICSSTHSESVSVSMALTEKSGEFHETQRRTSPTRFKNRSFSGEVKRERTVGRSPGRRSDPSPNRNRPGPGYGRRRDSGDSSGRNSKSPVISSNSGSSNRGLGRGKSSRKTDSSPGRVESGSDAGIWMMEEETGSEENMRQPTKNELLENPLVSLECFIFL